jgi:predicted RND superfamily exporter protein
MSFAAIPISIGVGADYAANLWSRIPERTSARVPAVAATVALCSLTTIIGYSSLLLGRNGALRSFGLLCDIGELSCIAAVLLSLFLFSRRRS